MSGLPTSNLVALESSSDRVVIDVGAGARLASLVARETERLITMPSPTAPFPELYWGCYPMAPWAGRIQNALLKWNGNETKVRPNLSPHSIHGLVFDKTWTVVDHQTDSAITRCDFDWELGGYVSQRFVLTPGKLQMELEIVAEAKSIPVSAGWHPWFARPVRGDVRLRVPANEVLEVTSDLIPSGRRVLVAGDNDLRRGPDLGGRRIDVVYSNAGSPALIRWPDLELSVSFAEPMTTVAVYTPPEGFCIEPQSAWPDAARLDRSGIRGTGHAILAPGNSMFLDMTWTWHAA